MTEQEFLTYEQASEYTGLSASTLRNYVSSGDKRKRRLHVAKYDGRRAYFARADLDAYFARDVHNGRPAHRSADRVSIPDAAHELGISEGGLYLLIRKGKIVPDYTHPLAFAPATLARLRRERGVR